MKENIKPINSLNDLLHFNARVITDAEIEVKSVLHSWAAIAHSMKLKEVLLKYADYIELHIQKMESFFTEEMVFPVSPGNRVMNVLIEGANEKMARCADDEIRDACLLAAVQEINHHKICLYGTAASFAITLEMEEAANFFHEAEISEKQIDDRLSQLAQHEINPNSKAPTLIDK